VSGERENTTSYENKDHLYLQLLHHTRYMTLEETKELEGMKEIDE
jgi:hypothetical protein